MLEVALVVRDRQGLDTSVACNQGRQRTARSISPPAQRASLRQLPSHCGATRRGDEWQSSVGPESDRPLSERDLTVVPEHFRRAIELDANLAEAHLGAGG